MPLEEPPACPMLRPSKPPMSSGVLEKLGTFALPPSLFLSADEDFDVDQTRPLEQGQLSDEDFGVDWSSDCSTDGLGSLEGLEDLSVETPPAEYSAEELSPVGSVGLLRGLFGEGTAMTVEGAEEFSMGGSAAPNSKFTHVISW